MGNHKSIFSFRLKKSSIHKAIYILHNHSNTTISTTDLLLDGLFEVFNPFIDLRVPISKYWISFKHEMGLGLDNNQFFSYYSVSNYFLAIYETN